VEPAASTLMRWKKKLATSNLALNVFKAMILQRSERLYVSERIIERKGGRHVDNKGIYPVS
jgi:hypothetical protein